ncbi:enoyl-CoA hydratase/isomerase family protein [Microlunatus sp. Gsoil 973]|jgi:enoyl-CoA hydratase/carnithine racemase|uniref:enoyl-CoA hydratase/isomerase family protein n=1 Tax=Microlunatus sp. Gsoil 973 TaxID=2672569 RepID=UPI0012B48996|nr:enoyl-CoA hydratase-related protein [Microlunatus sp. Gsoil 973]QGN32356.1 enoyl-CoA hydratase/isomerase family protein [Microlunatus sp. Gsoil 973]
MSDLVRLEVTDGVATLRIDRPEQLNALNADIQARIAAAAREADRRDDIAAVVLTGGDKVFAAGADVKEMADLGYAEMAAQSARIHECFNAVAGIAKPVIAAINGYALGGGCELALCADVRFAAQNATLGQPEIKLGVIPGAGGTQRLTRLVGPSRAKEIIFSGRFVGAEEALRIGLLDRLLPATEVYPAAVEWAKQFVGGPRLALSAAKQAIDLGAGVDLATGLEIERQLFAGLFATEDRTVGMRSFVENGPGKARFTGR